VSTGRLNDRSDLDDRNDRPTDPDDLDDLNFLREWREPIPRARIVAAIAGAIVYHLGAIAVVVAALNAPPPNFSGDFRLDLRRAVVLYTPPDVIRKPPVQKELTQRDPNRGKITNESRHAKASFLTLLGAYGVSCRARVNHATPHLWRFAPAASGLHWVPRSLAPVGARTRHERAAN